MGYSMAQLEQYWIAAGGPSAVAPTMAAIAMAESSGSNVIQQGQPYATTGWGLWQITPGNSVPSAGTDQALLDPANNARAAVAKYNSQGLGAWTTYTSGAFRQYLGGAPAASSGSASPTGATLTSFIPTSWWSHIPVIGGAISFAQAIGQTVMNPGWWRRIGVGMAGVLLMLIGSHPLWSGAAATIQKTAGAAA